MEVKKSAMTACENFIYRREEKTEAISRSFLSIRFVEDHYLRSSFSRLTNKAKRNLF